MTKPDNRWFILGIILIITFSSLIGINQYYFGMWNQFIALPWLYDLIDPGLYPHDPLIAQRESSPSFYNYMLKGLAPVFGGNIGLMHFVIFIIFHLLTFVSFYKLSMQFFNHKRSAILALIALCGSFSSAGYVPSLDSALMERTIALPVLIFSLVFLLRKRWPWAILLQALAFNIHPLSSVHFIFYSWLGVIFAHGLQWKYIKLWGLLILLVTPVLYLRWQSASGDNSFEVSTQWMKVMHLRNYWHAFPSRFDPILIVKAALITLTFFIIVGKSNFSSDLKKWLNGFGIGVLILVLIGTVFTEIFPIRLVIQLQFYRSIKILTILTIILWAGLIIRSDKKIFFVLAIPILFQYYSGISSKFIGMVLLIGLCYFTLTKFQELRSKPVIIIALLVLSLGLSGRYLRGDNPGFHPIKVQEGSQDEEWYEIQEWFRYHSAPDALAIVPPSEKGFRVKSLRTSYGDWYDGTKAFFSEEYALLWWERMQSLNCTNPDSLSNQFRANTTEDFQKIWEGELKSKHSEAYVVTYADMNLEGMELAFENEDYKVFRL